MSPANPVPSAIRVSVTRTGSQTPRASPWRPPQALPGGPHSRRDKPQTTVGPAAPRGPPRSPSFLPGRGVLRPRGIRQEHVPNGWPWQATRAGSERHRGSCCGPDGGLKGGQSHPGWASHGPRGQKERGIQALERARSPVSPARRRGGCWSGSPRPPSSSLHSSPRLCRPWPPPLTPPPGSGSEPKQRCTPTQDTVCGCKPGTEPQDGFKRGVDCAPCPPGHFSPGDDQACKPWTNCTLKGKRTVRPASQSSDAVCEDRSPPATLPWETQGPPAWPPTTQPTTAWARASQEPFTPPAEPPRGPQLAAVLGLGLGLLAPVAAALALLLHHRAWRLPPSGNSFRTPIQEEHSDANSALAKI